MTYKEAEALLGDNYCIALPEPYTRLRIESDRCIALYYESRPVLKLLWDGSYIIHFRGIAPTAAARDRVLGYGPSGVCLLTESQGRWAFCHTEYNCAQCKRDISGGLILNADKTITVIE